MSRIIKYQQNYGGLYGKPFVAMLYTIFISYVIMACHGNELNGTPKSRLLKFFDRAILNKTKTDQEQLIENDLIDKDPEGRWCALKLDCIQELFLQDGQDKKRTKKLQKEFERFAAKKLSNIRYIRVEIALDKNHEGKRPLLLDCRERNFQYVNDIKTITIGIGSFGAAKQYIASLFSTFNGQIDLNGQNQSGETLLTEVIDSIPKKKSLSELDCQYIEGCKDLIKLFLDYNVNPNNGGYAKKPENSSTPLIHLLDRMYPETRDSSYINPEIGEDFIKLLCLHPVNPADPNRPDGLGMTPLMMLVHRISYLSTKRSKDAINTMTVLIRDCGADPNQKNHKNQSVFTMLNKVMWQSCRDAAYNTLLDNGADPNIMSAEEADCLITTKTIEKALNNNFNPLQKEYLHGCKEKYMRGCSQQFYKTVLTAMKNIEKFNNIHQWIGTWLREAYYPDQAFRSSQCLLCACKTNGQVILLHDLTDTHYAHISCIATFCKSQSKGRNDKNQCPVDNCQYGIDRSIIQSLKQFGLI